MAIIRSVRDYIKHLETQPSHDEFINQLYGTTWQSLSLDQFRIEIRNAALALRSMGMKKGDRVAIYAYPSIRWTIVNIAIMAAGGVAVPMFINISEDNFKFQMKQTEAEILFIDGSHFLDIAYQNHLYESIKDEVKLTVAFNLTDKPHVMNYDDFVAHGERLNEGVPTLFETMLNENRPEDPCSIIYTSGSTGVPKGAEYSQLGIFAFFQSRFLEVGPKDKFLSFLPLAHIYGYVMNLICIHFGVSIYYLNDIKMIAQAAREIHPTIMILVPRLLEKLYSKFLSNIQSQGFMKKNLGLWAFDLAKNEEEDYLTKHLLHPIADVLIYSKMREVLGNNLRIVISGSAPLNPALNHFFLNIGVPIYEGYGMTECCPISLNQPGARKIGSVGIPINTYQVKTTEEGELLVKGDGIMLRYYKDPLKSAETITFDGWLKTGDKAVIDEDGYISIVGRIKELFKTSTGEFVAPVPIEHELIKVPLIESAVVIAEGRKFTTALLFPDKEVLKSLKITYHAENTTDEDFIKSDFIRQETQNLIDQINKGVNKCEQILDFRYVLDPLTVESGDLTPTLKIRREVIAKKYAKLIETMYKEEGDS